MQRLRSPFRLRPSAGSDQRKGKPRNGPDLGRGHTLDDASAPDLRRAHDGQNTDDGHDTREADGASERNQESQAGQPVPGGSDPKR